MDFKEWQEINDGLCMSSREYAEAAWNASREQAINECVEVVAELVEAIDASIPPDNQGYVYELSDDYIAINISNDIANKLKDLK